MFRKFIILKKPNSTCLHMIIDSYKDCFLDKKKLKKIVYNYKLNYKVNR